MKFKNIVENIIDEHGFHEECLDRNVWKNKKGKLHRESGPAIEYVDGDKSWYLNGKRHREDGPAIEWLDGYKEWRLNGELHREDGPAIEYSNGTKYWYLNGKHHTEKEYHLEISSSKDLEVHGGILDEQQEEAEEKCECQMEIEKNEA